MKFIQVYADTSVFGGVYDAEFRSVSRLFMDQVKSGRIVLFTSAVVQAEIFYAPKRVQDSFAKLIDRMKILEVTESALNLRDAYLKASIVPKTYSTDALHVAVASVSRCPIIASWNFKHIVHFGKIAQYNAVNLLEGFTSLSIHSPAEVIDYE